MDIFIRDCRNRSFHTFDHVCVYIKPKKIGKDKMVNLTVSGKSLNLYELKKKLKIVRQNSFNFIQKN